MAGVGAAARAITMPQMMMGLRCGLEGGVYVLRRFFGAMVGDVASGVW